MIFSSHPQTQGQVFFTSFQKFTNKIFPEHIRLEKKKEGTKKGNKERKFGRGSKLTFLSKDIQNKLIDFISKEIVVEIFGLISNCIAWAVIADTTPDVARHEQLSLCVRVVERNGEVSDHLQFCIRVDSTTAEGLLNAISNQLKQLEIPFDDLVAQTYDGASNMSGRYNGLQAKFKQLAGEHVIFANCYAHTLNLVLSASLEVVKLFDNLQSVHVMFTKSQLISDLFEKGLKVHSLKRINTVRWSAREQCLEMFIEQYDAVLITLERLIEKRLGDADKRSAADGLLKTFQTKQLMETAYLFKEIFSFTGPLSRVLQGINIDFSLGNTGHLPNWSH
ncbi:zinc finger MYM-type protein 1-like [Clytia hemisphaerica]|uniref:zinc finger MYM-type protein 1-like n=1 Tax=Clytia hemisphaerica TaxID=252671 RepID=UPI0034D512F6